MEEILTFIFQNILPLSLVIASNIYLIFTNMKKSFFLFVMICLANIVIAGNKYWVGTTGNYSDGANWNSLSDGSGTPGAPVNTDDIIIDRNAIITIDGVYFPSSLQITNNAIVEFTNASGIARVYTIGGGVISPAFNVASGCTLNVTGTSAITLTVASGSTASILGTLDFTGSSSKMDNGFGTGIATLKTGGKIRYGGTSANGIGSISTLILETGSIYEVYKNGGSFPTATYHPNSLVLNTGSIANPATFAMNSATGSYGNYEFNSPGNTNSTSGLNNNCTFNNLTITNNGSGKWVFSTNGITPYTLTINGNLTLAAGTTLDINRAGSGSQTTTILVNGNVLNNGTITETNANTGSLIELGGGTSSTFSTVVNGINNDVSMRINKTSGAIVTALTDITLPNSSFSKLTLTSGHIDMLTNNKLLFIQNPSFTALIGGSIGSHIIGKLKRSSNEIGGYGFPVSNNAAQLAKATITTSSTNTTDWTVDFLPVNSNATSGLAPGTIDIVSSYAWDISRTGATPANADFLTLFYGGLTTSQVLIPAQVKVVRWNGAAWDNFGGTDGGGSVDNALGSTGGAAPTDPITSFGTFAIGGIIGVLPVEFSYFNGVRSNEKHILSWKINNTGSDNINMQVQRSADGRIFNSIYSSTATALRCLLPFENMDEQPLPGNNYYRIKTEDARGKVKYSSVILLFNKQPGLSIISMSPNPVSKSGLTKLNIASIHDNNIQLIVRDMQGKQCMHKTGIRLLTGNNQLNLDLSVLSSGTYQLSVISNGEIINYRFVKD